MISTHHRMKKYCKEQLSCIENYELAVNDQVNRWDLHHKDEIELDKTKDELIEMGLYWNCPAERLIFLHHNEHIIIHNKVRRYTEETKQKMSDARKGKKLNEETKRKIGDARNGKKHTEETKQKMSDAHKGLGREIEVIYDGVSTKYKTILEAANKLNISVGTIQNIIKRKHKPRKNLIIRYL